MTLTHATTDYDIVFSLLYLKSDELLEHQDLPKLLGKDFPLSKQYKTTHEILEHLEEVLQSYNNQLEPYSLFVHNKTEGYGILLGKGDQGMVQVTNLIKDSRKNPAPYQVNFFSKYEKHQDKTMTLLADNLLELEETLISWEKSETPRQALKALSHNLFDFKAYHDLDTEAYMVLFTLPGLPYLMKLEENLQEVGMDMPFAFWE